jgi:PIN domain nuclease of toxin-antitoxin system
MRGVLLDTHALYWLVSGEQALTEAALVAIGQSQEASKLFVSPITGWELALAARKPRNAPQFGGSGVAGWFRAALSETAAKLVSINQAIAVEAANVVSVTGHKDPGDCYLIATARVRRLPLISRDTTILALAADGYLDVIIC